MDWRKSSYSQNSGHCVEVAAAWHKSSHSHTNGDCVEVAELPTAVKIRDTQHRQRGHPTLPKGEWAALLHAIRRGEV